MLNQFLHEQLTIAFEYGVTKPEMPSSITQNLNLPTSIKLNIVESNTR